MIVEAIDKGTLEFFILRAEFSCCWLGFDKAWEPSHPVLCLSRVDLLTAKSKNTFLVVKVFMRSTLCPDGQI